ncbi:conserved exported hypothetical protein [Paraburkholderia piptadeniae]|uniref:Lipoprotein n=1 Tax=Paraburkholderia piptadeniae TaxID=1701573 RepID=A0A1N7RMU7_9BURK|nr:conserved exported hypothetical protein [Paraburkholderia piptadeniae]
MTTIKPISHRPLVRSTLFAAMLLAGLTACQKNDASAGQTSPGLNNIGQQASQKLDQAASYVGQQVDAAKATAQQNLDAAASGPSIKLDPGDLASQAQANFQGAASATNAAVARAMSSTGAGLESAGRKLQQWSSETSSNSQPSSTDSDAQKQMDK